MMRADIGDARMTKFRLVFLLAIFAVLSSCADELSPDQREQLAHLDKLPLYFAGGNIAPPKATEKVADAIGYSCKTAWLQSSASEEDALKNLWQNGSNQNGTAVVNVSCAPISFFTPQVHCWPGIYCKGDAVK
jgi:hypothetical protein